MPKVPRCQRCQGDGRCQGCGVSIEDYRSRSSGPAVSDGAGGDWHRRHAPGSGLLGGVRHPRDRRRPRRARPHLYDRARQRNLRRGDRGIPPPRGRLGARRPDGGSRSILETAGERFAIAVARARKRGYPPVDGGGRQRRLGSVREGRAQAVVEAPGGHAAGRRRSLHRLQVHHRRFDPGRGHRSDGSAALHERRPRARLAAIGLPGLYDLRRLDRVLRWPHSRGLPRRHRSRLDAFQGEGRRQRGGRLQKSRARARGNRPGSHSYDRRQPAVGRAGSDRPRRRAGRVQPALDRGAHQSRRCARSCGDCPRRRSDRRRHRRALRQSRSLQAAAAGARRSASVKSTAAGSAASTRTWPSC